MAVNVSSFSQKYLFFCLHKHSRRRPEVTISSCVCLNKKHIFLTRRRDIYNHFWGCIYFLQLFQGKTGSFPKPHQVVRRLNLTRGIFLGLLLATNQIFLMKHQDNYQPCLWRQNRVQNMIFSQPLPSGSGALT